MGEVFIFSILFSSRYLVWILLCFVLGMGDSDLLILENFIKYLLYIDNVIRIIDVETGKGVKFFLGFFFCGCRNVEVIVIW